VRFEILDAASVKIAVFWFIAHSRPIDLMMEAASTFETSVNFYQNARSNNPEDSHLQETRYFTKLYG
jgi:hypothetical protein